MCPSSTSNSEPRRRWAAPGLWGCLALLLAFELGVARQDWFWRLAGVRIVEDLEDLVVAPAPTPRVVVLGSSRLQFGIAPRVLEDALNLPVGSCLNLAMGGGTSFDALLMYRRNRDKLSRAQLAVIGIEDWYYNGGYPPNPRDARFASLRERWEEYPGPARPELLFNWLWQTSAIQTAAQIWMEQVHAGAVARLQPDGRFVVDHPEEGADPHNAALMISRFYANYSFAMGRHHQLQRLIDLCRSDGLQVMVVQMPLRDEYVELAERDYAAAWEAYRRTALTLTDADVVLFPKLSELGLSQDTLYDYGHAANDGAAPDTRLVAEHLREHFAALWPRQDDSRG